MCAPCQGARRGAPALWAVSALTGSRPRFGVLGIRSASSGGVGLPSLTFGKHDVEVHDQFAHAGSQRLPSTACHVISTVSGRRRLRSYFG